MEMKPWLALVVVLIVVAAAVLTGCGAKSGSNSSKTNDAGTRVELNKISDNPGAAGPAADRKTYQAPPAMTIDPSKRYFATLKTDRGDIRIELFASESPKTVNNFVFLAREGFYDGIRFHRIIRDYMIQTGDPNGDGSGGPGYEFADELPAKHSYEPGIVAMANAGPDTNGSQFFICSGPLCKGLDQYPNYTQFGRVVEGMDVVRAIAAVPVRAAPWGEVSQPTEEVRIRGVAIEEGGK